MKKILILLCLAAFHAGCGGDNSSTVSFEVDANGCLVGASGFDTESRVITREGVVTATYIWECASYENPGAGIDVEESKVTLIFTGTTCLELTATDIGAGYCTNGITPVL